MPENPFFSESALPFNMPPFDRITDADYVPAFEKGMADHMREVEAIASDPGKPTFDNTIVALERAGRLLARVSAVFDNLNQADTNPRLQKIDTDMAPVRAAHDDAIHMNPALFARISALYGSRTSLGLDAESLRLLERYHRDFVRAGAKLPEPDKARLKALNGELATLESNFTQNVLGEVNASKVVVADRAELAGLSQAEIEADRNGARYEITLDNTTGQPPLTYLQDRALRQRIMEASLARGSRGGPYDNRAIISRIARLRAEQVALLGYDSFAAFTVEDQTARTVGAVDALLAQLAGPAVAKARREAADMQAIIDAEHGGFQLAACDWAYYSEKVRRARYSIDEAALRPYFELEHVLEDGVFFAANRLYGISLRERHDLPVYNPDVRVFEVYDADSKPLGLLLEDFYARPSKQGGAWMNEYVTQSSLLGHRPVVGNHHNIPKPAPGEPTLLTFDEVVTLFHEFGHGLHGLFSSVNYPLFGGTGVPRDFVEFPSQVNEMWASWPEVVRHYARHYRTGEPIPEALLDKMLATSKFNQGYETTEYLEATIIDQAWHELKPAAVPGDVPAFEASALHSYGVDYAPVPPRYHSTYFTHTFSGNYASNYYAYIWADVLVADTVEWISKHGGLTRENGERFRSEVLSRGDSREALGMFRALTGGDPDVGPLLRRRGLEQGGN
jgi:peptidyl-dipeptidase Dcp